MSAPLSFYTVEQTAEAVFKDRGSEFIACIFPVIHEPDFKHQLIASKNRTRKRYIIVLLIGWVPRESDLE